jgi:hypothetical protein
MSSCETSAFSSRPTIKRFCVQGALWTSESGKDTFDHKGGGPQRRPNAHHRAQQGESGSANNQHYVCRAAVTSNASLKQAKAQCDICSNNCGDH